ncbi:MAG: glutaredoxin 3 [Candidatus Accumulibacter sp.]|jgi:glutaredoxin 3|nr:glutaredoxin 3 [Accumulibacter sp.]
MSAQPDIVMYTTVHCPYCLRAEKILRARGANEIKKLRIDLDPDLRDEMTEKTSRRTVPQIFIGGRYIGGCEELIDFDRAGRLQPLLSGEPDPLETP